MCVGPSPAAGCRRACGGRQPAFLTGLGGGGGGGLRHGGGWLPARPTAAPPSLRFPRSPRPFPPPRPVPSGPLPAAGPRGTHRVRVGAEVLEGEGAEDEAREQSRRALALHALDNGGPRRGGGSPQRPPAAGQGRARSGTWPSREEAAGERGGGVWGPGSGLSRLFSRAASALAPSAPASVLPRSPGLFPPPARRGSVQTQPFWFALNGVILQSKSPFCFWL